ncbi:ABC transporter [Novosphingobium sp.]|uniref:ABC transporter n=1 Tax=Novosphingobium sp. TaxID=1874826 RepID=UPI0025ED22F7|nr:ABC transporter [Novosphingobium sp.]
MAAGALLIGAALLVQGRAARNGDAIGLFTTLPILWNEEPDVASMLKSAQPPHWARKLLADRGRIIPLDTLSVPGARGPLDGMQRMVMAQPRALGGAENVALDRWVHSGGRLLLLADPALTEESNFSVGDPRRPQAVVLLSPILKRWGLELQFDDAQTFGDRSVMLGRTQLPVNLPGRFAVLDKRNCGALGGGIAALCRLGKGRVLVVADAAVLERDDPDQVRAPAFAALLDQAFND